MLIPLLAALSVPGGLRGTTPARVLLSRREGMAAALAASSSALFFQSAAHAETQLEAGGALGSTCLGFGCNS